MSETALKFGPEWLRALSHGNSVASPPLSPEPPKYKLADYRYGREEMLALFPKDPKMPDSLIEFTHLVKDKYQLPLALMPTTDEEQRIWATSVNSDLARGVSGKGGSGPGVSISRTGRGGSVDRGRGRGRGSFFPRGLSIEDGDDGPPGGFPRPRPMERSQSANEKDQRWDDRDRRYERPYTGRTFDDSNSIAKQEGSRAPADNWRKTDKMDDDGSWRTAGVRGEKHGTRGGSWRNHGDKDRDHEDFDKPLQRNHEPIPNGPAKSSQHKSQRHSSSFWDDDTPGNLPEWIMDKPSDADLVGSFDSSGAFLETKIKEDNIDEIYASDEEEDKNFEGIPEPKPHERRKSPVKQPNSEETGVPDPREKAWVQPSPEKQTEPPDTHPRTESSRKVPSPDKTDKVTNNVIIPNIPQQTSVAQPNDAVMLNVPDKSGLKEETAVNTHTVQAPPQQVGEVPSHSEEDAFAHHKKATENMVAQWTEEEEHHIRAQSVDKTTVLPPHHDDAYKWFYRDPQGEIQGPFASSEMLEWFQSGYFTMGLMVRRGCDEIFSQLGHLIKVWGQVPFHPMVPAPPIRAPVMTTSPPTPMTQTAVPNPQPLPDPTHQAKSDEQLRVIQQQLLQQQLMQQQLMIRQAQLQQLLTQLKTQDNFTNLNPQQQYEVLLRQYVAQQSLASRPGLGPMGDQSSILEQMPTLAFPLLGLPMPSLLKNDISLWGLAPPAAGPWPVGVTNPQPPTGSIWDTDQPVMSNEAKIIEEQKRIAEEERKKVEELRKLEEEKKKEERRKREEIERKLEEERLRQEYLKKQEEERRLLELKRQQEEQRRQEELKRIEEQKRKEEEERQLEEQRRQEELRQQEEKRRQEELEEKQRQEALRKKEEKCRLEEQKKLEEQKRLEEQKKIAEQKRLEELKRLEERKKQEELAKQEEIQNQKRLQREKEQQKLQELEKQKELEAKELKLQQEREQQWELEKQQEIEKLQRLQEQKLRAQGPVWGGQISTGLNSELSLADIQRLQEEKEKEEREERLRQQQMLQQYAKQTQQSKNGPSWAKRSEVQGSTVLSLAEIQQEEVSKLAQQQKTQKPKPVVSATTPLMSVNPWGNSSHILNKMSAAPSWNYSDVATTGFWDDAVNNTSVKKSSRTNDSAFPALNNIVKPASVSSNKGKTAKGKKGEENVLKFFESHRKPLDEFTQWCTDALSNLPSSLDVPTFVAFLKDIESPYEVHDYVRSYLGESKEAREFGKQFLERRSKCRNQAKQTPAEENMWGPAPAITPSVNKPVAQNTIDSDGHVSSKGKTRKKKNRMQKVDNSMLGFTVQSNPDRINVGEIDHVDGM